MPDVDVKGFLLSGPEVLMQNLIQMSQGEKQEPLNYSKVLRTFVLNSEIKAEISSSGSNSDKMSGIVDWIGERKDGQNGIELFLRSRSGNKIFTFGENTAEASFNGLKRVLIISETPENCPICKSGITAKDTVISCPSCNVRAHRDHFLEYLKIHGSCPKCGTRLSMKQKGENPS